jgi:outer membrane receptor protein involved in Fe transport
MRSKGKALSLTAVLVSQFCVAGVASAQEAAAPAAPAAEAPAPKQKSAEETIVVTGSRVRRSKELTTPAPVTVIGREQIQSSGAITIGDFLQLLPEQGGALNSNVNNGGDGETQISLRGVGPQRTLILVDGKRMVNGGVGVGTAVDLNTIPTASVERVEILKDGASAVYGSDAIGGVVNIITRKKMDGIEASAYEGISQHGDAEVRDLNLMAGVKGEKGSFMIGAGYYTQDPMFASARDWATNALSYDFVNGAAGMVLKPGFDPGVGTSGSGTLPKTRVNALDPSTCSTQLCKDLTAAFGSGKHNFIYDPTGANTTDGWRLRNSATDFYNYQAVNYLVTPSQRISLFGNGEYRFSDNARAYVQGSYVNRQSETLVAPEPFVTSAAGVVISGQNPYNPFGVDLSSVQRRLSDLAGRSSTYEVDTFRMVTGLDGTLPEIAGPLQGWFWDVSFNYGRTAGVTKTGGFLNTQLTQAGLGAGFKNPDGTYSCGTADNPTANCTPVNLFGAPGTITSDMAAQLGAYTAVNYGVTQMVEAQANLSGELFKLMADRPSSLAVGFSHRNEYGFFNNEPILAAGFNSDTGAPGPKDTAGHYYVNEGYGELSLPIINHTLGAENLELTAAARLFNYNTFGTDNTYKLGFLWMPIRDVTLRGTYSTGFRAPQIIDLYQGLSGGVYESSNDPCSTIKNNPALVKNCGAAANNGIDQAQINSTVGGNPLLQPEKAKVGTIGVVLEPSMVKNLAFTVDYFTISMDSLIGAYGTQFIVNKCYGAGGIAQDTSFCNLISRDNASQGINHVLDVSKNVGTLYTNGIDIAGVYSLPTDFGRFLVRFNGTYLMTFDQTTPDGTVIHGAGNYDGGGSVIAAGGNLNPRFKFNAAVNYAYDAFAAALNGRYIGGFTECAPDGGVVAGANTGPGLCYAGSNVHSGVLYPTHSVSGQMTFDLMASYRLKTSVGTTGLQVGITNVLDSTPPRVYDSFLTYADSSYNFVGRAFYGRIEQKF